MKFLSDILAKAGLTVDGVVTFNNTATGQTPQANDNSTKLATTAFIKNQSYLTANQTITVSGDATGSGTTSIALTLANSGVTAGTYGNASNIPTITVDAKGRITSISTNAVSIITTLAGLSDVTLTSPTTNQVLQYNGTKWVNGAAPVTYTLPIATASSLGGIKVGSGLSIDSGTGILSVSGGGAASIQTFQTYIATAGQTVFTITGGYTAGLVEVFLNGSYLSPNQYTATNGTTITLNDAAVLSDIIDVILTSPIYSGGTATTTDQLSEGTSNLYFTNARVLSALSGRTLTINGVAYDLSANRSWTINSMVYPAAGIAVSTGTAWTTSITDNSANWNTAYGWGNHASAGYATTTYVGTAIANLVASAPAALDTLNELAAALGNDAAFSTTVTTALGNRLRIDIGTQGLTSTQQGYGRTNLGLGSLATLSSIGNSYITDLAWSKITGAPSFITSYTETDTLASVTGRGATTTSAITINKTGTLISHAGMTDAIGYNASYGTYIGSPLGGATYYLYANGQFNNNGTIVSLLHAGNYSSYAAPAGYGLGGSSIVGAGYAISNYTLTGFYYFAGATGIPTTYFQAGILGSSNGDYAQFGIGSNNTFYYRWGTNSWTSVLTAESDTLASVTGRGASTGTAITITTALGLLVQASSEATIRLNNTGGGTEWRFNSYTNGNLYFQSGAGATNAVYFTNVGAATFSSSVTAGGNITTTGGSFLLPLTGGGNFQMYTTGNNFAIYSSLYGNTLTIDKTSGAAIFSSSVTATSFVKTGGTSTQFLMADGSVNTSVLSSGAYLPLSGGTMSGVLYGNGSGNFYIYNYGRIGLPNAGRIIYNNGTGSNMFFGEIATDVYGFTNNLYSDIPTLAMNVSSRKVTINGSSPSGVLTVQASADGNMFSIRGFIAGYGYPNVIEMGVYGADGYLNVKDGAGNIQTSLSGYTGTASYFLTRVLIGTTTNLAGGPYGILSTRQTTGTSPSIVATVENSASTNDGTILIGNLTTASSAYRLISGYSGNGSTDNFSVNQFYVRGDGYAYFKKSVNTALYSIAPNGTANLYNIVDADYTFAGSYTMQAGGGSAGYGGSMTMWGHYHASRAGYVSAGISAGSGGKFTVMDGGNGSGSDIFTVSSNGNVSVSGILYANSPIYVGGKSYARILYNETGNSPGIGAPFGAADTSRNIWIEMYDSDSGGLAIGNDGVTVYGAGDYGPVFRVIDEDQWQSNGNNVSAATLFYVAQDIGASWMRASSFTVTGDIVAYGSPSDARLKTIKEKVPNALATIQKLNGYRFDWKDSGDVLTIKEDIGVIAQEVAVVLPELARVNDNGKMSVRYQGLTAVLIEAVKEQQTQIESQKNEIEELKDLVKQLINR